MTPIALSSVTSRDMIGDKLGPFRIEDKLGQGAMGIVYRAIYEPTGQTVAVKVISHEHAARGNAGDRFRREHEILKQFRHPNIVHLIGTGHSKSKDADYYAMEYVPGRTLEQILDEQGPMPWTRVVELGLQICSALQYAHERGVVHRDLKPSNLMITDRGQVKLTDFGIAKDLDRTALTADGRTLGTAAYMAPEQIRGTPEVSHKTDLYALGCVLYQMLAGAPPYEARTAIALMHKQLEEPPPRPSGKNPDIPRALDKLIVKLMAKNRDDRPWDAQAVSQALHELREKAAKKETVPMVFDDVPANPPRPPGPTDLGGNAAPTSTSKTETARPRKLRKVRTRSGADPELSIPQARQRLETGLLIAALVGLVAILAYVLWPPSAEYLFRKAEEGMAQDDRASWLIAKRDYIDVLERRFPDHPYKQQVAEWTDRILLDEAERRAQFLKNPNVLPATRPRNDSEGAYQSTYLEMSKLLNAHKDQAALAGWRALAETLKGRADPEDRKWYLLCTKQIRELEAEIKARTEAFLGQFAQAQVEWRGGKFDEGARRLRELIERYGDYESLQRQVAQTRALLELATAPREPEVSKAEEPDP